LPTGAEERRRVVDVPVQAVDGLQAGVEQLDGGEVLAPQGGGQLEGRRGGIGRAHGATLSLCIIPMR